MCMGTAGSSVLGRVVKQVRAGQTGQGPKAMAAGPRGTLRDKGRPLGMNGKPAKLGLDDALGGGGEDTARGGPNLLGRTQTAGRNSGGTSNARSRTTSDRDRNRFGDVGRL